MSLGLEGGACMTNEGGAYPVVELKEPLSSALPMQPDSDVAVLAEPLSRLHHNQVNRAQAARLAAA